MVAVVMVVMVVMVVIVGIMTHITIDTPVRTTIIIFHHIIQRTIMGMATTDIMGTIIIIIMIHIPTITGIMIMVIITTAIMATTVMVVMVMATDIMEDTLGLESAYLDVKLKIKKFPHMREFFD